MFLSIQCTRCCPVVAAAMLGNNKKVKQWAKPQEHPLLLHWMCTVLGLHKCGIQSNSQNGDFLTHRGSHQWVRSLSFFTIVNWGRGVMEVQSFQHSTFTGPRSIPLLMARSNQLLLNGHASDASSIFRGLQTRGKGNPKEPAKNFCDVLRMWA